MSPLLLATTIAIAAPATQADGTFDSFAAKLPREAQTGTLLFSRGECLAIRFATQGPHTHVAAIVVDGGRPYIYDSMNGSGVRRLSLESYLRTHHPSKVDVLQPTRPFSKRRSAKFRNYLNGQLGRPYAVKHHVTGQRDEGLHCSEYVTESLLHSGLIRAERPSRVTPSSLADGLIAGGVYRHEQTLRRQVPPVVAPTGNNWCEQLWHDTKHCTDQAWNQLGAWFACK